MRQTALLVLVQIIAACSPGVTVVKGPHEQRGQCRHEDVEIILDESSVEGGYDELALMVVNTRLFTTVMINLDTLIAMAAQRVRPGNKLHGRHMEMLRRKAARMCADGLIIKSIGYSEQTLSIAAVAIKRHPRPLHAPRSPAAAAAGRAPEPPRGPKPPRPMEKRVVPPSP